MYFFALPICVCTCLIILTHITRTETDSHPCIHTHSHTHSSSSSGVLSLSLSPSVGFTFPTSSLCVSLVESSELRWQLPCAHTQRTASFEEKLLRSGQRRLRTLQPPLTVDFTVRFLKQKKRKTSKEVSDAPHENRSVKTCEKKTPTLSPLYFSR